jgi:two-component system CheB/CheR fusion protein
MAKHVFLIDADDAIRDSLVTLGEATGFQAYCYASAEQFLEAHSAACGGCILCEANLPGMTGLDLFRHLSAESKHLSFALLMSDDDPSLIAAAHRAGVATILQKPLSPAPLMAFLEQHWGSTP